MKKIFSEYGGVIVTVIAIVALIGLVTLLMQPGGVLDGAFSNLVQAFVDKTDDLADGSGTTPGEVTMLDGDGQVINKFAFAEVRFRSSAPAGELNEVKINGETVDPSNYIVTQGSTIITFKNDYVETLGLGEGDIEIVSDSGTATGGFTVVNAIPEGGLYIDVNGDDYGPGENFPAEPQRGDRYTYGDYEYYYGQRWCPDCDDWMDSCYCYPEIDHWAMHVIDASKRAYQLPLTQINGDYISDWSSAFAGCENLTVAPTIPNSVTNLDATFQHCTSLTTAPVIPSSVTDMRSTFTGCTSLAAAPAIPSSVTYMWSTFSACTALEVAPAIPNSVTTMQHIFRGCTSLTTAPAIPSSVTNMEGTFSGCTSLTNLSDLVIPNSVTNLNYTFQDCTSLTTAPAIPSSVTTMQYTFRGCTSLTTAPAIPSSVTMMTYTFLGCSALEGTIEVNANPTYCTQCFADTVKPIVLTGSSTKLANLAATANNGNVTVE